MNYLAIDAGGTSVKYAVITDECDILHKDSIPTIVDDLEQFIDSLVGIIEKVNEKYSCNGVALGIAGMLDSASGFMFNGGNISCINQINIVDILQAKCSLPVTVENDARCAAYAELWKGALKDCKDAVVIVCGTGIGGAIIKNREILSGSHFMAGEFSYTIIRDDSPYQMDNTFAANAGIHSLVKYVSEQSGIPESDLDGGKIFELANSGDENVLTGIRRYVHCLAVQINNYQFIFDPEKIVIGGGVSVQPLFIKMIREEVENINHGYQWELPMPNVSACTFYNDANLIGAVYAHIQAIGSKNNI